MHRLHGCKQTNNNFINFHYSTVNADEGCLRPLKWLKLIAQKIKNKNNKNQINKIITQPQRS